MSKNVAIVGVGFTQPQLKTVQVSYKEMVYEAAVKAYDNAHLASHKDIDGFVGCAEDLIEGTSIFDEYTPDQLGAVQKPVHTISGDLLHGLLVATMKIKTGIMDIVVVEAHSKASNLKTYYHVTNYALDPTWNRPLNVNPYYLAGLEKNYFMHHTKTTLEQIAGVVVKNKKNALQNDLAVFPEQTTVEKVLQSKPNFTPQTEAETAKQADGAFVFVLANEETAKKLSKKPVWITGMGWASDSPTLETRNWDEALYAKTSAHMALKQAHIKNIKEIDFFEIDDRFAYKELQHLESIGLYGKGKAGQALQNGDLNKDGKTPTNVSGGMLGCGSLLEAAGAIRALEVVKQLRGEAGQRQLSKANTALALSWRGIPTTSGAVLTFSRSLS
ncbi:MAG: acetyl-CoA acetyltransferase [Deltaproteobacteria bacterium]|nr:acetyl-CoA acetyltransferase [Deltaproteobacteria bacterium]